MAAGDLASSVANWNGDDAVGLAKEISGVMTLIDAIGTDGSDPGSGGECIIRVYRIEVCLAFGINIGVSGKFSVR